MDKLTSKEIDTLIDALEAWEKKEILNGLMGAILIPKDAPPEVRAELEQKEKERESQMDREERLRKETALLLKAKLVMMKQEMATSTAEILK